MQKFVRPQMPDWYDENAALSEEQKQEIIQKLLEATGNRCSYTSENLPEFAFCILDMFVPKDKKWGNLYVISRAANTYKVDKIPNEFVLRPDAKDYEFDKYFEINLHTGYLEPKNGEYYKYAVETINFFRLNGLNLVKKRKILIDLAIQKIEDVSYLQEKKALAFPFIIDKFFALRDIEKGYIDNIIVDKYHCIENLKINNLGDRKEIYFLGENGDGKTLLLQALFLSFSEKILEFADLQKSESIWDAENAAGNLVVEDYGYKNLGGKIISKKSNLSNVYAYGVCRSNDYFDSSAEASTGYGFSSLFSRVSPSIHFVSWLIRLQARKNKQGYKGFSSEQAIELFEDLLDNNVVIKAEGDEITFLERGTPIKFGQLSEGYHNILMWVTDLVARLVNQQPDFKKIPYEDGSVGYDFKAVVLVDEVNLHLHPKWEYQIVRKLRKWFPQIQFFFTTHSPVMVLGASKDAVFYRIYKNEEGITQISEPYLATAMGDWLANILITSPLFGLDSARAAFRGKDDESDTADDSLSSQIRKTVREEVARLKKEKGTSYFSRETLQALIDKALQNARQKP